MLVSVIIPCFNSEKFLVECIESVINQTHSNIEIILINDGSTDSTESIINSFKDKRIKYHYKNNGGHSSARNFGIEKSTGRFIAFLDSDDYWEKDKIEKQLLLIDDNDIIYTNYKTVNHNGQIIKNKAIITPIVDSKELKETLLIKNIILGSGSGVLLKREVIDAVGFFNCKLKIGEDWEYWARAAWVNFKFGYVDEKLVTIRHNDFSIQNTSSKFTWKSSIESILESFLLFQGVTNYNKALIYKRLLSNSYKFGNSFEELIRYYFKAIKNDYSSAIDFNILFLMIKFLPKQLKAILKS